MSLIDRADCGLCATDRRETAVRKYLFNNIEEVFHFIINGLLVDNPFLSFNPVNPDSDILSEHHTAVSCWPEKAQQQVELWIGKSG